MDFEISIPPITGDIVFCTGNRIIKYLQLPSIHFHRNVTHVAIMADFNSIAVAMVTRQIRVERLENWLESRSRTKRRESYYILRSEKSIEKSIDIQRRIAFYLNEPYRFFSSFRKWTKPGGSICTSFVGKVLLTANVAPHLEERGALLPGKLFTSLRKNGFREVPSEGFFNGARGASFHSLFDSALKLHGILNEIEKQLVDAQKQMIGWLSVVEKDLRTDPISHLTVWVSISGKDIRSFCADLSTTVTILLKVMTLLQNSGPHNWRDGFEEHNARIELLRVLSLEHYQLIRIFSEHLAFAQHLSGEDLATILPKPSLHADAQIYKNVAYYISSVKLAAHLMDGILNIT